jgi:hypothetical protein
MATTMATFERQLRRLRDDVEELRNRIEAVVDRIGNSVSRRLNRPPSA